MDEIIRELPKITRIVKAGICCVACTTCGRETPHIIVRTPGKPNVFICGACNVENIYEYQAPSS